MGMIVGWIDRFASTSFVLAAQGAILVELLIYVRNSFVAIPSHVVFTIVLLGLIRFLARRNVHS
jgi:hypothetical protein